MKTHIENLGIKSELSLTEIAVVLRNLVFDEWTGPYTDEYLDFFMWIR